MRLTRLLVCFGLLAVSLASGQWPETSRAVPLSQGNSGPDGAAGLVRDAQYPVTRMERPIRDGDDFLVGATLSFGGAPSGQRKPAVAFDGVNYLAVWMDTRRGSGFDLYAARVTPQGAVLDAGSIAMSTEDWDEIDPAVAFGDSCFLVVWQGYRQGPSDIRAARVTPEGIVLDTDAIVLTTATWAEHPSVAFDGANFLVVWNDYRSGNANIYGTRVNASGTVLDPDGIAISTAANGQWQPEVASDGTGFLTAWRDHRYGSDDDIFGARVTPEGSVLDPGGVPISTAARDQYAVALAFDGADFLVVWEDYRSGSGKPDIYGTRVAANGAVLDSSGVGIVTTANIPENPAVAFDGVDYLVTWSDVSNDTSSIFGSRVSRSGAVIDSAAVVIGPGGWFRTSSLGFDGTNFLVAYGWGDVCGTRVSEEGVVLDSGGFTISLAANGQYNPAAAFDGTVFLAVWEEGRSAPQNIYASRVGQDGGLLDTVDVVVTNAIDQQGSPAISSDGAGFLLVWQDRRSGSDYDIYGARVASTGTVLDSDGIAISTDSGSQVAPSVVFGIQGYLVVWQDGRSGNGYDIYGARVASDGTVLDPGGTAVSTAQGNQADPCVASDGANYLVAWWDRRSGSSYDIYAARVTPEGEVLDTAGIVVSQAANDQGHPSVAFDGANYLVAWTDYRNGSAPDVYAARVTPQGRVLDPSGIAIAAGTGDQWLPAVVLDGANLLVAWNASGDIHGAWVTPAGQVLYSGPVAAHRGNQQAPTLARGPDGHLFLAYQGWAWAGYNNDRIWGKLGPLLGVEETPRAAVRMANLTTILRSVLHLPEYTSSSCLLDISGREVLDLQPGANDVRALAPGVYFLKDRGERSEEGGAGIRKVVVTR